MVRQAPFIHHHAPNPMDNPETGPAGQNQTPETTKPLISLEIRGSGYIEFGGEGEIRTPVTSSPYCPVFRGL
jgi:hypothetical protein